MKQAKDRPKERTVMLVAFFHIFTLSMIAGILSAGLSLYLTPKLFSHAQLNPPAGALTSIQSPSNSFSDYPKGHTFAFFGLALALTVLVLCSAIIAALVLKSNGATKLNELIDIFQLRSLASSNAPPGATEKSSLELANEIEKLHQCLDQKHHLIRLLCHDLSNSLTIISGSSEILRLGDIEPEIKEQRIEAIHKASHFIQEMISKVRQIEALKASQLTLDIKPVHLGEVFDNLQFIFADSLRKKDLRLTIDNHLAPDTMCLADSITLCHQVLNNLVNNAIKFSYPGSEVIIKATQHDPKQISIQIMDRGVGMSQELLARIFDPSGSKTRAGTSGETGTGFGLCLVKTFVDMYGGTIEVESQEIECHPKDHGSTVNVYLQSA